MQEAFLVASDRPTLSRQETQRMKTHVRAQVQTNLKLEKKLQIIFFVTDDGTTQRKRETETYGDRDTNIDKEPRATPQELHHSSSDADKDPCTTSDVQDKRGPSRSPKDGTHNHSLHVSVSATSYQGLPTASWRE